MSGSCTQCHNHPCVCEVELVDPYELYKNGRDWQNHPIEDGEQLDDLIWVWQLEPATDGDGGKVWIRGYSDALEYMSNMFEHISGSMDTDDLKNGVVINASMGLVEVSLRSYQALEEM